MSDRVVYPNWEDCVINVDKDTGKIMFYYGEGFMYDYLPEG